MWIDAMFTRTLFDTAALCALHSNVDGAIHRRL